jgi:nitrile hydratase beta subunit
MDGVHDLGGMEGFGPVVVEADEPVFHAEWERRAFGMTMTTFMRGLSSGGEFRHSIERMDAVHYLTTRYYEHWFTGILTRFVETGFVSLDEVEARSGGAVPLSRPVWSGIASETGSSGTGAGPPQSGPFVVGDRVRVCTVDTRGHTRCPRYARGRPGTVVRVDPAASVPDVEAHSEARAREPVYCVRLDGAPGTSVHVDLWQSYLERA